MKMVKALRSLDKAKRSYETNGNPFQERHRVGRRIQQRKNNYENELLTYKTTKAKGEGDNVTLAKLDYYNARSKLAISRSSSRKPMSLPRYPERSSSWTPRGIRTGKEKPSRRGRLSAWGDHAGRG
jgi:hypothetical protein